MAKTSTRRIGWWKPAVKWRHRWSERYPPVLRIPAKFISNPKSDRATFHYSGDVRGLFAELSAAYGVTAQFDDSVQSRQVRFNVDDVDFFHCAEAGMRGQQDHVGSLGYSPITDRRRQCRKP